MQRSFAVAFDSSVGIYQPADIREILWAPVTIANNHLTGKGNDLGTG